MLRKYIPILVLAVVLLVATGGYALAQIGGGVGWFDIIQDVRVTGELQVRGANGITAVDLNTSDDLMVDDSAFITNDLTVTDDFNVTDDATLGSDLTLTKQTRVVVTDGSTITPLGSYQPISSTANTGTSSITAGTAGDYLVLINVGSSTITLTDTGTLKLSGNAALANNDAIVLLADGTNWIQISPEGDN